MSTGSINAFGSIKDDDSKDFHTYLQEARDTDLSEIERTGCVSEGKDFKGNHVIVMIPELGLNKQEPPEIMFRKMLLLFLRKTHEQVGSAYSIVYAHTNIDIINQYPLIYKFYSILPRSYKKNLQKLFVIHPNVGIRMFFEFARVFLSHKFYAKLCLLESILDFQRILPPTQLVLPLKFLRREDEENEVKYCGAMASLSKSFDVQLGTTQLLECCVLHLRNNNALSATGLFRVPGDENELNLARVRLQYAFSSMSRDSLSLGVKSWDSGSGGYSKSLATSSGKINFSPTAGGGGGGGTTSGGASGIHKSKSEKTRGDGSNADRYISSSAARVVLSATGRALVIGDLNVLYTTTLPQSNTPNPSPTSRSQQNAAGAGNAHDHSEQDAVFTFSKQNSTGSSTSTEELLPAPEVPLTVAIITNIHTVAQIFKVAIRDLQEPLVPTDTYNDLVLITRQFKLNNLSVHWEIAIAHRLALMSLPHLSTLMHVLRFLREVAAHHHENQMDTHNLAVVFAPTIFRPEMTDPIKAAMEVKLTQVLLQEIISRERILALALMHWKDAREHEVARVVATQHQSHSLPHAQPLQSQSAQTSTEQIAVTARDIVKQDIHKNIVLFHCFEQMAAKGWHSVNDIYAIHERESENHAHTSTEVRYAAVVNRHARNSTSTESWQLAHGRGVPLDEHGVEEESPREQSHDEVQSMMAAHMHSALRGRVNLAVSRDAHRDDVHSHDSDRQSLEDDGNDDENGKPIDVANSSRRSHDSKHESIESRPHVAVDESLQRLSLGSHHRSHHGRSSTSTVTAEPNSHRALPPSPDRTHKALPPVPPTAAHVTK